MLPGGAQELQDDRREYQEVQEEMARRVRRRKWPGGIGEGGGCQEVKEENVARRWAGVTG